MVEPGIEPETSWLVVRSSDHQTTRLIRGLKHGFMPSRLLGLRVRILRAAWMSVSCECGVFFILENGPIGPKIYKK
jgi:hypothetical protein